VKGGRNALELGKAAEHLTCADLIVSGYRCHLAGHGLPYDLVIDHADRLIRVQVKAASFARNVNMAGRAVRMAYSFNVRRRGKRGYRRLRDADCDLVALVALDIAIVAYLPLAEAGTTVQLYPPGYEFRGQYRRSRLESIAGFPIAHALARIGGRTPTGHMPNVDRGKLEFKGRRRTLVEWEGLTGISRYLISARLQRGWSVKDALTRPVRRPGGRRP